jgi:UDP-N-acetylglucosamine 2-epimerase (non-hydrolysing)
MPTAPASARRVLCVLGTRPEAIKFAPLVRELDSRRQTFRVGVCATGQHRELFDVAARSFALRTDWRLDLMTPDQAPSEFLSRALCALTPVLAEFRPDLVLVQGDTTSTLAGALAAYYARIPVGHVEAGLRSGDPWAPFPEEQHRRTVDQLARWLFAPTEGARQNLLREGLPPEHIHVTGNTGVDALRWLERRLATAEQEADLDAFLRSTGLSGSKASERLLVVATIHRRELGNEALHSVAAALRQIAQFPAVDLILPLHPNPNVRAALEGVLGGSAVRCIQALEPERFVGLLRRAALVITDSGGVQEEAATLGVPALIVRSRSDRPESVASGGSRVVGHDTTTIVAAAARALDRSAAGHEHPHREPFGDGRAAERIADVLAL